MNSVVVEAKRIDLHEIDLGGKIEALGDGLDAMVED